MINISYMLDLRMKLLVIKRKEGVSWQLDAVYIYFLHFEMCKKFFKVITIVLLSSQLSVFAAGFYKHQDENWKFRSTLIERLKLIILSSLTSAL